MKQAPCQTGVRSAKPLMKRLLEPGRRSAVAVPHGAPAQISASGFFICSQMMKCAPFPFAARPTAEPRFSHAPGLEVAAANG
jgi:hypothetical protein